MYYIKNDVYNFIYDFEFHTREEAEDFAKKLTTLGANVPLTSLSQEERDDTLRAWDILGAKTAVKRAKRKLKKANRALLEARADYNRIKEDQNGRNNYIISGGNSGNASDSNLGA